MWERVHNYYHVLHGLTKLTTIIKIKNHTIWNNNMSLEGEMLGYSGFLNFARMAVSFRTSTPLFSKWGRDSEVNGGFRERTMRRMADSQSGTA